MVAITEQIQERYNFDVQKLDFKSEDDKKVREKLLKITLFE